MSLKEEPRIIALDFDGVLLDGIKEYFQTSKKAYYNIWKQSLSDDLAAHFYQLRPVVETGWEMPVLLRSIVLGIHPDNILQDWHNICQDIISTENLHPSKIMEEVDSIRDNWIASDLENWLSLHQFYPGVITKLMQVIESPTKIYIVTTKDGRFVKRLLHDQGVELADQFIIGKECKRPKYETLNLLIETAQETPNHLWFVEDRAKTLQLVQQQANLQGVRLFLADWGYNTRQDRDTISHDLDIKLLSLNQFNQDFSHWLN